MFKGGFDLEDIQEVNDETEEMETAFHYRSVPVIRIDRPKVSFSAEVNNRTVNMEARYRKLSDPGSPPPNEIEIQFEY